MQLFDAIETYDEALVAKTLQQPSIKLNQPILRSSYHAFPSMPFADAFRVCVDRHRKKQFGALPQFERITLQLLDAKADPSLKEYNKLLSPIGELREHVCIGWLYS